MITEIVVGLRKEAKYREDKQSGSLKAGDLERNDDAEETSMVDSVTALEITPDDVVGVIGENNSGKQEELSSSK
ncbi:hypothetical protein H0E87_007339, partial [Populus deltoides]